MPSNDLTLVAESLPPSSFGLVATSSTLGASPVPPGGSVGRLCLAGTIGRYAGSILMSGPAGRFELALDLDRIPSGPGFVAVQPGETRYFQAWYRDVVGGAATSNFTDTLGVAFP